MKAGNVLLITVSASARGTAQEAGSGGAGRGGDNHGSNSRVRGQPRLIYAPQLANFLSKNIIFLSIWAIRVLLGTPKRGLPLRISLLLSSESFSTLHKTFFTALLKSILKRCSDI